MQINDKICKFLGHWLDKIAHHSLTKIKFQTFLSVSETKHILKSICTIHPYNALNCSQHNAHLHKISDLAEFFKTDLFDCKVSWCVGKYLLAGYIVFVERFTRRDI